MRHEGEVGYPLANLTEMQVIKSKYLSVFYTDTWCVFRLLST